MHCWGTSSRGVLHANRQWGSCHRLSQERSWWEGTNQILTGIREAGGNYRDKMEQVKQGMKKSGEQDRWQQHKGWQRSGGVRQAAAMGLSLLRPSPRLKNLQDSGARTSRW